MIDLSRHRMGTQGTNPVRLVCELQEASHASVKFLGLSDKAEDKIMRSMAQFVLAASFLAGMATGPLAVQAADRRKRKAETSGAIPFTTVNGGIGCLPTAGFIGTTGGMRMIPRHTLHQLPPMLLRPAEVDRLTRAERPSTQTFAHSMAMLSPV